MDLPVGGTDPSTCHSSLGEVQCQAKSDSGGHGVHTTIFISATSPPTPSHPFSLPFPVGPSPSEPNGPPRLTTTAVATASQVPSNGISITIVSDTTSLLNQQGQSEGPRTRTDDPKPPPTPIASIYFSDRFPAASSSPSNSGFPEPTTAGSSSVKVQSHPNGAVIAAAILAVIVGLGIIAAGVWYLKSRRRRRDTVEFTESLADPPEIIETAPSVHEDHRKENGGYLFNMNNGRHYGRHITPYYPPSGTSFSTVGG